MKSLSELQAFYNSELLPQLEKLEEERKRTVKNIQAACLPVAVLGGLLGLAVVVFIDPQFGFFICVAVFAVCAFIFHVQTRAYVSDFKSKVIQGLVTFIDPNLQYIAPMYIDAYQFSKCGIFRTEPDHYKGDDLVRGTLGATEIQFSEIHAQYETRDSKGRRHLHTIFKGLFFIGDFNKHFHGRTYVLTDAMEGMGALGTWFQKMGQSRGELVKLEDPEFEKRFVVYSTDQIEARYILSTSLMARIVEFTEKSRRKIQLSFVDSRVYIAVPYNRNLFEPNVFETLLNFEPIRQYFEDLQLAAGIVEDLNLNLRIWNKS